MRIIRLQEGTRRIFSPEEIDQATVWEIIKKYPDLVEVEFPTPLNNQNYMLLSKSSVGVLPLEDGALWIEPKVEVHNVFKMLEYAYDLESFQLLPEQIPYGSLEESYEWMVSLLAEMVVTRARKGLYQAYIGRSEDLPYIRGRLVFEETAKRFIRGQVSPYCEYEENSVDIPDNQILLRTLYLLSQSRFEREDVKEAVQKAYRALAGTVTLRHVEAKECAGRTYNRLNEDYRPMHSLCRLFLACSSPAFTRGAAEFFPFVVDMKYLYERFVARWLDKNGSPSMRFVPQYPKTVGIQDPMTFFIDVVVMDEQGQTLAVLDTKYKGGQAQVGQAGRPVASDIHQMVSYATMMRTGRAALIYPTARMISLAYDIEHIMLRTMVFDLDGDLDAAGRAFLTELESFLFNPDS